MIHLRGRSKKGAPAPRHDILIRIVEAVLGLASVVVSVIVLANPLLSVDRLVLLLAFALSLEGGRLLLTGGIPGRWWRRAEAGLLGKLRRARGAGLTGIALLSLAIVAAVLVSPELGSASLLVLVAVGVVALSLGRIVSGLGAEAPGWLRGSAIATGVIALLLVALALALPGVGLATFAILLALTLFLDGVQSVVAGLHPTDRRQLVLLKLILFSAFYGLVLINWIDLFGKSVPAYGIWLIFTYFAPFGVLIVYEGLSEWPLALSLGLFVSLANDVGYFFVGNLLFGFHKALLPWIEGQLGFQGTSLVTVFQAGSLTFPVYSWMMGLSIYLRAVVVTIGLHYWWQHPSRIVARL